jgi:hypothetical protein
MELPADGNESEEAKKKKWFGFIPMFSLPSSRRPTAGSVSDLMGKMSISNVRSDVKEPSGKEAQLNPNFKTAENCIEPTVSICHHRCH